MGVNFLQLPADQIRDIFHAPADVARDIVRGIERNRAIITVDWKFRILVFFWRLVPQWIWVRLRISTKK